MNLRQPLEIKKMVSPIPSLEDLSRLTTIRRQSLKIYEEVKNGKSKFFSVYEQKLPDVVTMIEELIKRDYAGLDTIPPHGRWRHFQGADGKKDPVGELINYWKSHGVTILEATRRIFDLFFVAVLLDAGAGPLWKYHDGDRIFCRSEGLAVATFFMFTKGLFSSDPENPFQVDSGGLEKLTPYKLAAGFQISEKNPLIGLDGRFHLLKNLAKVVGHSPFQGRPGHIVDALANDLSIESFWRILFTSMRPIWPSTKSIVEIDGQNISLGDCWYCDLIGDYVPFHKLTQWMAYSLMEPLNRVLKLNLEGEHLLTGLPEYRNGGLFLDLGVLELKVAAKDKYNVDDQLIIEWRALTVILLDMLADRLRQRLGMSPEDLPLSKVLEAGSWKAGREIAKTLRASGDPPINIVSDGTVF